MRVPSARDELLTVALLGAPRIERDGRPLEVDTRKAVALLSYLAVTGGAHRRDTLAALLWPEADPARGRGALRRTLSVLSKGLAGRWLVPDRETVSLDSEGLHLDVARFRCLAREAATSTHPMPLLEEAAQLHRGEFLAGFGLRDSPGFDDWQCFQTESLRRERADVLGRLVAALAAAGEPARAIGYGRQWLEIDPLHEAAHRELIRLYAWTGDRSAAIEQYRHCVRLLDHELGVEPLQETTALYEAMNSDTTPTPPWPVSPAPPVPMTRSRRPAGRELVGRDADWRTLVGRHAAVTGDGHVLIIEGEAGIGKTRLAEDFVAYAAAQGAITITARCHEGEERLAYGLITEALRTAAQVALSKPSSDHGTALRAEVAPHALVEAARLVPEFASDFDRAPPLDSPGAQARMLDSIAWVLTAACAGTPAGVLVLDDLHWADDASLDAITYLARRLEGRPLCVVLTWRHEQVPAGHRLRRLAAETIRKGTASRLDLDPLSLPDVGALVATAGLPDPESLSRRLHAETGGLPFFVVEYLNELETGRLPLGAEEWPVPGGVRDLLRARIAALSQAGRQVCASAAVVGSRFDAEALRAASGRSEDETVAALEELLAAGFVTELPELQGGYDFTHPRIRALVYDETSLARRRLLHRRVAEALRRGRDAAVVAHHYRQAGEDAAAAEQYALAGEHAMGLFANAEALAHLQAALAFGHRDRGRLHEAIGDLHTLEGDYRAALASYEHAAAHGQDVDQKLGQVHHRRGHWQLAEHHLCAALDRAKTPIARAGIQVDRSLTAHRLGEHSRAKALASDALTNAETTGDTLAQAQAHNLLGILATSRRDHAEARRHLEHSLALATDLPTPAARVAALNNLSLACAAAGDSREALALAIEALELGATYGDRHRQAALHNNLADLLHAAGRDREAITHLTHAARLFTEVDDGSLREPEIWKLTEW